MQITAALCNWIGHVEDAQGQDRPDRASLFPDRPGVLDLDQLVLRPQDRALLNEILGLFNREAEVQTVNPIGRLRGEDCLAVLLFCYVKEIYASQEIVTFLLERSGGEIIIPWEALKQFRRVHRGLIERLLFSSLAMVGPASLVSAGDLQQEVQRRLREAVFLDCITSDL
jgi:hypothetical protein